MTGKKSVTLQDGAVLGLVKVESINLDTLSKAGRKTFHGIYSDLLDSITYPVKVHSVQRQFDLEQYIHELHHKNREPSQLRSGYVKHCRNVSGGELITTDHYISVRVSSGDTTEARKSELDNRIRSILQGLNRGGLSAARVTDYQLKKLVRRFDIQPELKPESVVTDSGEHRKTLYVEEYPVDLETGWPRTLLRLPGLIEITQVIEPEDPGDTVDKLERLKEKAVAEINSFRSGGHLNTTDLEKKQEDIQWFLQLLMDRTDKPFQYSCLVTVRSDSEEDCEKTLEQVENHLRTRRISFQKPVYRSDKAVQTCSPLHSDTLNESLLLPTRSVAAGFPFATQPVNEEAGVIYGVDTADGTPILLNRFDWNSYASFRAGKTGSGKSFATGLELVRSWLAYDDLQIIAVDPKNDYAGIIWALGGGKGDVYSLEQGKDYTFRSDLACFRTRDRGSRENVDLFVDLVEQAYAATSQDSTKTLVVIDEAHQLMNHETGRELLARWVREARDTNTAISLVTQNTEDFVRYPEGEAILKNVEAKAFQYHDALEDPVVDFFQLSPRERQEISKLKRGQDGYSEAILKVSDTLDTKIRIEASPAEAEFIEASLNSRKPPLEV
jgi:type IV secretory pathway VirB4 component